MKSASMGAKGDNTSASWFEGGDSFNRAGSPCTSGGRMAMLFAGITECVADMNLSCVEVDLAITLDVNRLGKGMCQLIGKFLKTDTTWINRGHLNTIRRLSRDDTSHGLFMGKRMSQGRNLVVLLVS